MLLFCLCFAVDAAVNAIFGLGEHENMIQLLLGRGDAARILTFYYIHQLLRGLQSLFLYQNAILDDVDGGLGVNIGDHIEIHGEITVDLDDILAAHFGADSVTDQSDLALGLFQTQQFIQLGAAACGDMVDDHAVFNGTDTLAFTPSSIMIRAIRIYLPLSTCLK